EDGAEGVFDVILDRDKHVFKNGHPSQKPDILVGPGYSKPSQGVARETSHVAAVIADRAIFRRIDSGDDIDEHGFAGSIRAHETENLAPMYVKRNRFQRDEPAKGLAE